MPSKWRQSQKWGRPLNDDTLINENYLNDEEDLKMRQLQKWNICQVTLIIAEDHTDLPYTAIAVIFCFIRENPKGKY